MILRMGSLNLIIRRCLGMPGDFLYHNDRSEIGRQALHSWKLEFHHPVTGELMQFETDLPEDMRKLL